MLAKAIPRLLGYVKQSWRFADLCWVKLPGDKNRTRSQRIERRDACMRALAGLLHYFEPVTRRVGCMDTEFRGVLSTTLCEQTGLDERRLSRALSDLQRAGFIKTFERAELTSAGYRGRVALRVITDKIFHALGLMAEFTEWRAIAARKLRSIRDGDVQMARLGDRKAAARLAIAPRPLQVPSGLVNEARPLGAILGALHTGPPQ